jgi:hypothetical protein
MFCSTCGTAIPAGQVGCPQCGQAPAPPVPPVLGFEFELQRYRGQIRALGICWLVYAGLVLVTGFVGISIARALFNGDFGLNLHSQIPPALLGAALHVGWMFLLVRAALAAVAGWGLLERTQWGRIVAIVAAILCMIKIPFGTAMGVWTLVALLGYRKSVLYDRL